VKDPSEEKVIRI